MFHVKLGDKRGAVSESGLVVLPLDHYEDVAGSNEGMMFYIKAGVLSFVTDAGIHSELNNLYPRDKEVGRFSEGLAAVRSHEGKCGYINKNSQWVIPAQFDYAWDFKEGLALAEINERYYVIDRAGARIAVLSGITIKPWPDWPNDIFMFEVRVQIKERDCPAIIRNLNEVIRFKDLIEIGSVHAGLMSCEVDTCDGPLWQLRRFDNQVIGELHFKYIHSFSCGCACAKALDGSYGTINDDGKWILPPTFPEPFHFQSGFAAVTLGADTQILNRKGESVLRFSSGRIVIGRECIFAQEQDECTGYDFKGERLWSLSLQNRVIAGI